MGPSYNLTKTVFLYCVFVYFYLCIWVSDTWEHCFWGPCTISFSKIYHIMGLSCFRAISGIGYGLGMGWMGSLCGAIVWASLCDANNNLLNHFLRGQRNWKNTLFLPQYLEWILQMKWNGDEDRSNRRWWMPAVGCSVLFTKFFSSLSIYLSNWGFFFALFPNCLYKNYHNSLKLTIVRSLVQWLTDWQR